MANKQTIKKRAQRARQALRAAEEIYPTIRDEYVGGDFVLILKDGFLGNASPEFAYFWRKHSKALAVILDRYTDITLDAGSVNSFHWTDLGSVLTIKAESFELRFIKEVLMPQVENLNSFVAWVPNHIWLELFVLAKVFHLS